MVLTKFLIASISRGLSASKTPLGDGVRLTFLCFGFFLNTASNRSYGSLTNVFGHEDVLLWAYEPQLIKF